MDEYIGIIKMFSGNFAPQGWMFCDGSILSIAQNQALFSIIGTTYGGDGINTFALPDLRGRTGIAYNAGSPGPGLSNYFLGQTGGTETVTLNNTQMPAHTHMMEVTSANADQSTAQANTSYLATPGGLNGRTFTPTFGYSSTATPLSPLGIQSISVAGGSQPHSNIQPYLAIGFIICTEGIYPSHG